MFVAIARMPGHAFAIVQAAEIAGLAMADAHRLLAGVLPRILIRSAKDASAQVEALERAGFVAFQGNEADLPTDQDRVLAREMEVSPMGLLVMDGRGQCHSCALLEIQAFLRGFRLNVATEVQKSTERKLSLTRAITTGGLSISKKVETTDIRTTSTKESFLLIDRPQGAPILVREQGFNYACLGSRLQPSQLANFTALVAWLRELAPQAAFDDRMIQTGFMAGLPLTAGDPADLAIHLVREARLRGC